MTTVDFINQRLQDCRDFGYKNRFCCMYAPFADIQKFENKKVEVPTEEDFASWEQLRISRKEAKK